MTIHTPMCHGYKIGSCGKTTSDTQGKPFEENKNLASRLPYRGVLSGGPVTRDSTGAACSFAMRRYPLKFLLLIQLLHRHRKLVQQSSFHELRGDLFQRLGCVHGNRPPRERWELIF